MSFLKFWNKTSKSKDNAHKNDKIHETDENYTGPPAFDRRERNQLSISRSGRYKQKKRQRSALMDNPHLSSSVLGQQNANPDDAAITVHNYDNGISIEKIPRPKITDYDRIQNHYSETVYAQRIHFPEHFNIESNVGQTTVL